jgi:tetratricopeptide (TPR) repeat protein
MLAHGGERKSARKVYMEVVASEQAGPDVLLKAAAGLLDMGEPNACLTACEAALRREKSPAAFVQRSRCRLSAGDEADATKDLRHALSLDPRHAPAQFYLAELHLANGNKKEALDAYKRCAMLAPDTPLALRAKERMREAQSGNAARR